MNPTAAGGSERKVDLEKNINPTAVSRRGRELGEKESWRKGTSYFYLRFPTSPILVVRKVKDGGERKRVTENLVGGRFCIFCNTMYVSQPCVIKQRIPS